MGRDHELVSDLAEALVHYAGHLDVSVISAEYVYAELLEPLSALAHHAAFVRRLRAHRLALPAGMMPESVTGCVLTVLAFLAAVAEFRRPALGDPVTVELRRGYDFPEDKYAA